MNIAIKLGIITASVLTITGSGGPVLAARTETNSNANAHTQTTEQVPATSSSNKKEGLPAGKVETCRRREQVINTIMSRIADRGTKQLDVFTKIAERTEKFYTDKGKTLSNYDALVADVNAKKIAAQTAVDTIRATSVTFKCDGTDPKGAAASFKNSLRAEQDALKAYKTAVKNLIVGVKSVQADSKPSSEGDQQ